MTIEQIAQVCHEVNRAYCTAIGDDSQVTWVQAPDWQQESAIKGVEFTLANPGAPISAQHESWLQVKQADGWTYGPVKDAGKKEHPCMVPYAQLPWQQQVKDHLFRAVVYSLAEHLVKGQ
jgi:RyR domain-containing protein